MKAKQKQNPKVLLIFRHYFQLKKTFSDTTENASVFVKLLHHQVLNYSSKSCESAIDINSDKTKVMNDDQDKLERGSRISSRSKDKESINSSYHSPQSPVPDYYDEKIAKSVKDKRLISKSISNLLDQGESNLASHRNISASTVQLNRCQLLDTIPSIPKPDYEKNEKRTKAIQSIERDVWGNANRFRGSKDNSTCEEGDKNVRTKKLKEGINFPETLFCLQRL